VRAVRGFSVALDPETGNPLELVVPHDHRRSVFERSCADQYVLDPDRVTLSFERSAYLRRPKRGSVSERKWFYPVEFRGHLLYGNARVLALSEQDLVERDGRRTEGRVRVFVQKRLDRLLRSK
jgi:hypothetical protein